MLFIIKVSMNRFTFIPTVNPVCPPYKNPKINKIDTSWYETDVHFKGFAMLISTKMIQKFYREHNSIGKKIQFPKNVTL